MVTLVALQARRNLGAVPCNVSVLKAVHAQPFLSQLRHLLVGEQSGEDVAFFRLVKTVTDRALEGRLRLRRRVGDLVGEGCRLMSLTLIGVCRLRRGFDGGDAGSRGV